MSVPLEQALQDDVIGTNSGNLIFSDATHKLLLLDGTDVVSNGISTDVNAAARINADFDVFVVPLANAFRPSFESSLKRLTTLIGKLRIPVVVLGVGAQAPPSYDAARLAPIEKSVRAFVDAVLDRGPSIGVRGEFTLQYLNGLGYRDVEVIGCPSMFMNGPEFKVTKRVEALTPDSRISVNGAHSAHRLIGPIISAAHQRYPNLRFVGQNTIEALQLHWRDESRPGTNAITALPTNPAHPMYQEGKAAVFVDPVTWIDDLRGYDFSFGTRIHGNIAALLAGTPATVLCHDARTLELCRYFGIPHRLLAKTPRDIDPAELYDEADFSELTGGHPERFRRFADYLDRHGLENTFTHGDGGAAYDAKLGELTFPGPAVPWTGPEAADVSVRLNWLRARQDALEARYLTLEKGLSAAAPAQAKPAPGRDAPGSAVYRRARRVVGRSLKRTLARD
ncbi:polysaccharide pyruvyl transferase family protein [Streptomyces sp. NPDC051940]|uniref:polysaccharide pyruvyl transferase family protein n=1 Tax=Streptomyces sp. NPDC051940 TaxID=3155675 RepID=UPI0034137EF6